MDGLKHYRREVDRDLRKLRREARHLDAKVRLLSGQQIGAPDRDRDPPRMLQPGNRGEVARLRGDVPTGQSGGSSSFLSVEAGQGGRSAPRAPLTKYGVLQPGRGRGIDWQRGPVSMLSRRHDRPMVRDDDASRTYRNRVLFLLVLTGMALLVLYHFAIR